MRERSRPQLHRALADERRQRIVDELQSVSNGLDARELAGRLGLHANTIRWHLGILSDAGMVASEPEARAAPGRPRILYRLSGEVESVSKDEHRLLATVLAGAVAQLEDGTRRAVDAGRAWGRYLVRRPLPLTRMTREEATAEVASLLEQQGFSPQVHADEIHMHRCPFHDLAETRGEIVCGVHRGLIAGALSELGTDLEVAQLRAFVRPDLCVVRLARRAPHDGDRNGSKAPLSSTA